MNIILSILILGAIILIHELGHFLMAKVCGIGVVEFSQGMGPRLFSVEMGETKYSIKAFPFGGSCAMLGEDEEADEESAFGNKSVWARIAVVAGGPVFNFILAFFLAMILVGVSGGYTVPEVLGVEEGFPAKEAGLLPGDVITHVNGRSIHSYRDFTTYVFTHPGKELKLTWKREGEDGKKEKLSASVTPVLTENGQQLIGVQFQPGIEPADTLLELMRQSVYEVQFWIRYVFDTFYMMFHGAVSVDDISGPVGIVSTIDQTVDEASQAGAGAVAMTLVNFGVLLSANLGVMNLIPFPALDGGRLFFLFLEALRGKPVDQEKEAMIHTAGMALLLAFMVFILFNDVRKLF